MWNMSDRAIPRSLRTMEGFGIHTFRLTNADGETSLAKFHWKSRQGVHSLTWEEAQMVCGLDPDFHRRDLADAIESGVFPQWDFGAKFSLTPTMRCSRASTYWTRPSSFPKSWRQCR